MELDDAYSPSWDKSIGASVSFYVFAILFNKYRIKNKLFDGRFVANHTRPIDRVITAAHFVSVKGAAISLCIALYYQSN